MLNLFWVGFSLYTIGFTLATTQISVVKLFIMIQFLGLGLFLFSSIKLFNFKFSSIYLKALYTLFCVWSFIVVLRGLSFNYDFLKETFTNPYGGILLYMTPLILLIPQSIIFYRRVFTVIATLGITFLICSVLFHKLLLDVDIDNDLISQVYIIEFFAKNLSIPSGFLLLTYTYHSKARRFLSIIVITSTILFAVITARRGLVFSFSMILLFYAMILLYRSKRRVLTILIFVLGLSSMSFYMIKEIKDGNFGMFGSLNQRMNEDTRGEVEMYYYADMGTKDWILGRGMSGLVAAPYTNVNSDYVNGKPGYRDGIETDYLNIILKGGIISLGLLLLLAVPAAFKGIFFSKNLLSKAAGIWILLWMIDLYPTTVTSFTLRYLLVWICIGICYSKKLRNIPEGEMKRYFLTT